MIAELITLYWITNERRRDEFSLSQHFVSGLQFLV